MYEVLAYEAGDGSYPYEEFKNWFEGAVTVRYFRIVDAIVTKLREVGLALLETSMMGNIEDDIYELRPGSHRVFCFYDRARNSVGQYLNR